MKINENKIKKFTLLAAIFAPMIYLFGSLFASLQGSHGEITLAQPVYNDEYISVDSFSDDGSYILSVDEAQKNDWIDLQPNGNVYGSFTFTDGLVFDRLWKSGSDLRYIGWTGTSPTLLRNNDGGLRTGVWLFSFEGSYPVLLNQYSSLQKLVPVPTDTVVVSPQANNDYLFSQFFTRNNFLAASGEKVINGAPDYGFAPAADMIRYIDSNMLHLANLEWGYLVIGYVYYAFHVTIVFLMFELLMFFPHLIENIYEKFERGW